MSWNNEMVKGILFTDTFQYKVQRYDYLYTFIYLNMRNTSSKFSWENLRETNQKEKNWLKLSVHEICCIFFFWQSTNRFMN